MENIFLLRDRGTKLAFGGKCVCAFSDLLLQTTLVCLNQCLTSFQACGPFLMFISQLKGICKLPYF